MSDVRYAVVVGLRAAGKLIFNIAGTLSRHNLTDWAAALTYYGLLAIFPSLITIASLIGLFADPDGVTSTVTEIVDALGPQSAAVTLAGAIRDVTTPRSTAGVLLIFGVLASVFTASSYLAAFSRASQIIYEVDLGKPFWEMRPRQLVWTGLMILGAGVVAGSIVLTGPAVEAVANPIGIGDTAVAIWSYAKWPVLVVMVSGLFSLLFFLTAPIQEKRVVWVTAGGVLAVTVWLLASAILGLYVANFGSYDKTYGTLGGVIILLVWIYVTNVALLLGVELNADQQPGKAKRRRESTLD